MSLYYFDTNALVKLVLAEKGHDEAMHLYDQEDTIIIISSLSNTEIYSALNQKKSRNEISEEQYKKATLAFNNVILKSSRIMPVEITSDLFRNATLKVMVHSTLRSLDALHLVTALEYNTDEMPITFVTADKKFKNVIIKEGINVMDFETCKCPKCGSDIKQTKVRKKCATCNNTITELIVACTRDGCDYQCHECNIEFCKKYVAVS